MSRTVKHPGALWATQTPLDEPRLPLPYAVTGALLITVLLMAILSQVQWHPLLAPADDFMRAVLVQASPPPPPAPPKPKPPEIKKIVKQNKVLPLLAAPPKPTPTPPAQIVAAVHAAPNAPAIATAPPSNLATPSVAPVTSANAAPSPREIGVVCPHQVQPEMPRRAIDEGITGTVRARAVVDHGVVKEVSIISGPSLFYAAVRRAMLAYQCEVNAAGPETVEQTFQFRLEE